DPAGPLWLAEADLELVGRPQRYLSKAQQAMALAADEQPLPIVLEARGDFRRRPEQWHWTSIKEVHPNANRVGRRWIGCRRSMGPPCQQPRGKSHQDDDSPRPPEIAPRQSWLADRGRQGRALLGDRRWWAERRGFRARERC